MTDFARDIENKADLHCLVTIFYQKVLHDPLIGFFFTDRVQLDLESHIPVIVDFWAMQLWGDRSYQGSPFATHKKLDTVARLTGHHFKQWLHLFHLSVQETYTGPNAEKIRQIAANIASRMSDAFSRIHLQENNDAEPTLKGIGIFDPGISRPPKTLSESTES